MRVELTRKYRFEAAHWLPHHRGKCASMHGHSYRLLLVLSAPIRADGMLLDFEEVDAMADPVIATYDHRVLNDVLDNPTCELVAVDAFSRLRNAGLPLVRLTLWETERGAVTVSKDDIPAADLDDAADTG
jgi:6-pyruvoyltetrahydropterin/6-carboxytetrahydropterin synthase